MCGIPDKKPFRHFPMPLGGATGAIPLKIFQGKSFLARRPLVMFRPNRSVKPIGFQLTIMVAFVSTERTTINRVQTHIELNTTCKSPWCIYLNEITSSLQLANRRFMRRNTTHNVMSCYNQKLQTYRCLNNSRSIDDPQGTTNKSFTESYQISSQFIHTTVISTAKNVCSNRHSINE